MSVMTRRNRRRCHRPNFRYILPHNVQNRGTDQTVLYGAREQKGTRILHKRAHYIGPPALEHVMRSCQTSGKSQLFVIVTLVQRMIVSRQMYARPLTCKTSLKNIFWGPSARAIYPNDGRSQGCYFLGYRTSGFRVSSPEQGRSAKLRGSFRSCASVPNVPLFCVGTLSSVMRYRVYEF